MSTWYAQLNNGNFSNGVNQWNSNQNGSGSWGAPGSSDTCDLNGMTVNVDNNTFIAPSSVVDGSGGGGLLLFNSAISDGRTWVCSCNVKIAAGLTVTILPGALSIFYVSSTCGKLDVAGVLNLATIGSNVGSISMLSGVVPVTVETGGTLTLQRNAHIATFNTPSAGGAPAITVSGTLNWPLTNNWLTAGCLP
jgi:hypothetical protein